MKDHHHIPFFIILGILIIVLVLAAFGLLQTMKDMGDPVTAPTVNTLIEENPIRELSEAEQVEVLDELLPEDVVDTEAEREEQIDLLEQLMNQ